MIARPPVGASSSGAGWGAAVASGMRGAVASAISRSLLLAHDEAVDTAVDGLLDELVAGALRPGGEVLDRPWVGREHLDRLAGHQRLDGLGGLDDGHRAVQPAGIDLRVHDHHAHCDLLLLAAGAARVAR